MYVYTPYIISFLSRYCLHLSYDDTIFIENFTHGCVSCYLNYYRYSYSYLFSFHHFIVDTLILWVHKFHKVYFAHHVISLIVLYYVISNQKSLSVHPELMNYVHDTFICLEITAPLLALTNKYKNPQLKKVYAWCFYLIRCYYGPYALMRFVYISNKYNSLLTTISFFVPLCALTLYGVVYSRKIMRKNKLL